MDALFLKLPTEVIERALEELDASSLVAVQQTCSRLRDVIVKSSPLQYKLYLKYVGMRKGSSPNHINSWSATSHAAKLPIEYPKRVVSGNILAAVVDDERRRLAVWQLPSQSRQISDMHWELEFDQVIGTIITDASQDLLILANTQLDYTSDYLRVQFLSLSTGLPHPENLGHEELATYPPAEHPSAIHGEICGDYVAVLVLSLSDSISLIVWNWKTSMNEAQSSHSRCLIKQAKLLSEDVITTELRTL
ncbi:hypothetical protein FA95DRAFT_1608968 [Auriscalpium vulgare]|uniref:Uncharacterized protein n=1 Tax=Auriscalpium vulgare TaxID=40419 RepID=A0ACB8RIJ0_9AGAM|nr:hypothetical protein FA95DRAFT_1608968 [Auriscalpium vulgare]